MRAPYIKLSVVALIVVVSAVALHCVAAEPEKSEHIKWQPDIYAAHEVSLETGKPILLVISGESCAPCAKLKSTTLGDPRVVKYVNALFVPVQLDFAKDSKVVEILEVEQIPTTIVLSPDADLLGRLVGYAPAEKYHAALEKTRRFQKKIETLKQASADKEPQQ